MRIRQDKHGRKGNIGMACFTTEDQAKLAIKMLHYEMITSQKVPSEAQS